MSLLSTLLPPKKLCQYLSDEPEYQDNKERVGVVLHEGFRRYDQYEAARPYLFAASVATFVGSGYMWWRRGLRKKGKRVGEAHVLYPMLMAVSGAVAYVTRPAVGVDAEGAEKPLTAEEASSAGFMGWVEQKRKDLKQQDPNFADKAMVRFLRLRPINPYWGPLPEHVKAIVTCRKV